MDFKRIYLGITLILGGCSLDGNLSEDENEPAPLKNYESYPDLRDFPTAPVTPTHNKGKEKKKCP